MPFLFIICTPFIYQQKIVDKFCQKVEKKYGYLQTQLKIEQDEKVH
jgi:hypothetical protein